MKGLTNLRVFHRRKLLGRQERTVEVGDVVAGLRGGKKREWKMGVVETLVVWK